jgi:hypothetical protein
MDRRRWKLWVVGIALAQLLIIGVEVAQWPTPDEAEMLAAKIAVGATREQVAKALRLSEVPTVKTRATEVTIHYFDDGSECEIRFDSNSLVYAVRIAPSPPVPPLTRLRRTLARAFPFLGE